MKHEVIDNFLDEEYFDSLVNLFIHGNGHGTVPWFFQSSVAYPKEHKNWVAEDNLFYMTHTLYQDNIPTSSHFNNLLPLLKKLKAVCLIRAKANLFPHTHILHEHPMHTDYDFFHSGAILSLNTCDGYTKLKDGTKIDSIANRVLLHDAGEDHGATTTTNVPARFNIILSLSTHCR